MARRDLDTAILDAATDLAVGGGFDNVRQRDVAERAGVSLATLYKRFRSKEELLAATMARTIEAFEQRMAAQPARGDTPSERLVSFFDALTSEMRARPHYARAVLRATASGPDVAGPVVAYQGRLAGLVIAALRSRGRLEFMDAQSAPPQPEELELATLLLQIWFSLQVGWSAGLFDDGEHDARMRRAIELLAPALGL